MLYLVFIFILGTIVGSFLNVCIHRLPRGESVIYPASHCPACGQKLRGLELVPVAGYFILGGRCRYCKKPISFRYPLVELMTGALFAGVALAFPLVSFPLEFFAYLIFSSLMIIVFFTDLEQQIIPDSISITGVILGLLFNFIKGMFFQKGAINVFLSSLFGMLIGYVLLYLIAKLGKLYFKKEVMGEGDLYLAALLGAYLGWQGALLSIFMAYLLAGVISLVLLALGKIKMGGYLPFGPALVGGGIIALFFGERMVTWYLKLFT